MGFHIWTGYEGKEASAKDGSVETEEHCNV